MSGLFFMSFVYVTFADIVQGVGSQMGYNWINNTITPGPVCSLQGFLYTFDVSSALWAVSMSVSSTLRDLVFDRDFSNYVWYLSN